MSTVSDPRSAKPLLPALDRPRNTTVRWHVAAVAVIWGTSLAIVALWVHGGAVQALVAADAQTLDTLGRLTGLVSANLLLYQVLLMARVPVFEHGFGHAGIVRLHRLSGLWSVWLLVAHIVLITAGYAVAAGVDPLVQLWLFTWDYPGMLLAVAGTVLLGMVAVSSARRARRRLRYESWHLLHLYGYLGAGLAVPHVIWTGGDFGTALPDAYWWGLWAVTMSAVLVFRIGRPLWRSVRVGLRVVSVRPDGSSGVRVRMRGRHLDLLGARAGQFFIWRFLAGPGWMRGHPFSLAEAPTATDLVIAADRVGDGTHRLSRLRPGTPVFIEGPFGHLTGQRRTGRRVAMFAAGSGVAPLVGLLQSEPYAPGDAVLVTRDHADGDPLAADLVADVVTRRGVVHYALDGPRRHSAPTWIPQELGGWGGPDLIRALLPDTESWDVFVCGVDPWVRAVRRDLRAAGIRSDRIHAEAFTV